MGVIDEVKQRTDIVEIVSQYVPLKKSGKYLKANCPFHNEKTPSFYVYPEQQSWHCFGACSTGGDVFSFLMKKDNLDFGEALRQLAERAGVELPQYSREQEDGDKEKKERLYQVNEAAAVYFSGLLRDSEAAGPAREYIAKRDLNEETVKKFRLGFSLNGWEDLKQHLLDAGFTAGEILEAGLIIQNEEGRTYDRFRNRLMFPISDARGRVIGFGGRVLDDSLPKYMNSPQTPLFDKSSVIYAIDLAAPSVRSQDQAVLVEGYMDVITAHQHGFTNVVAAMGTAVTERQILILKRLSKNLALALDSDSAGEEAMLRCVGYENTLEAEVKVIIMPEGQDPDDVIKSGGDTWKELVSKAVPVMDYTIDMLTSRLDMATAAGQTLAVNQLGPVILQIKDPVRQAHYKQKLARVTDKDMQTIEQALGGLGAPRSPRRAAPEKPRPEVKPLLSSPVEEDFLSLLLQHYARKGSVGEIPAEFFDNSVNREIYTAWLQADDIEGLKARLAPAVWENVDRLAGNKKEILASRFDERYNSYVRRLREEHVRGLARKRSYAFGEEAELSGMPQEQDLELSTHLREIFIEKGNNSRDSRR